MLCPFIHIWEEWHVNHMTLAYYSNKILRLLIRFYRSRCTMYIIISNPLACIEFWNGPEVLNSFYGGVISNSMTTKFEKLPTFLKPWSYKNWMLIADVFSIKIPYLQGSVASAELPDWLLKWKCLRYSTMFYDYISGYTFVIRLYVTQYKTHTLILSYFAAGLWSFQKKF